MCYMNSVHCIYLMLLAIGLNKLFLIPDSRVMSHVSIGMTLTASFITQLYLCSVSLTPSTHHNILIPVLSYTGGFHLSSSLSRSRPHTPLILKFICTFLSHVTALTSLHLCHARQKQLLYGNAYYINCYQTLQYFLEIEIIIIIIYL